MTACELGVGMVRRALLWGLGSVAMLTLPGCWWTQPGFDARHSYHNPGESRLTGETVGGLVELWDVPTGGSSVLAGRTVYVATSGEVSARDARTGAVRWSAAFSGDGGGAIFLHDGVLYRPAFDWASGCGVGHCTRFPADGRFESWDAATGEPRPRIGEYGQGLGGAVAVGRTHVVAPTAFATSGYHVVHSWSDGVPDRLDRLDTGFVSPVIDETRGRYVTVGGVFGTPPTLTAMPLTCEPCQPAWSHPLGAADPTALALAGDRVVLAYADGTVELRDAASGTVRTSFHVGDGTTGAGPVHLAGAGPTVVAARPGTRGTPEIPAVDGTVAAFACDTERCSHAWTAAPAAGRYGQPVVAGDLVYVARTEGDTTTLEAYRSGGCDAATCSPIAAVTVTGDWSGDLTVAGGQVGLQTSTGLHVLGLPSSG